MLRKLLITSLSLGILMGASFASFADNASTATPEVSQSPLVSQTPTPTAPASTATPTITATPESTPTSTATQNSEATPLSIANITPTPTTTTSSNPSSTDKALKDAIKTSQLKLNDLRDTEKQLSEEISQQSQANNATRKDISKALGDAFKDEIQSALQQVNQIDKEIKTLNAKKKELTAQLNKAKKNNNTNEVTSLTSQITDIDSQVSAKKSDRTSVSDNFNAMKSNKRDKWVKAQTGYNNADTIAVQILQKRAEIINLDAIKTQDWIKYRQSDIDSNLQAKSDALNSIISDKQQEIAKTQELFELLKQAGTSLKSTLSSL